MNAIIITKIFIMSRISLTLKRLAHVLGKHFLTLKKSCNEILIQ